MSYEDKDALLYLADVRIDELQAENAKLRDEFRKMDEWHSKELVAAIDENAKLRELVWDMYCLAYPSAVEWEVSDAAYDKYSPCEKCNELCGGKSPCARTAKDMAEEYCKPIQAVVVADRMKELGVDDG